GTSSSVTLESVQAERVYELNLTTNAGPDVANVFFRLSESRVVPLVRAEEVSLVVLVLMLWALAIILFVHRWGKIRMLEPYQPEYKALDHAPNCPLAPTTPAPKPLRPHGLLHHPMPRKSSSLCFTPSMLRPQSPSSSPVKELKKQM
ncbi:unnamed protein product, partial [Meganyctiphanes norvegica]